MKCLGRNKDNHCCYMNGQVCKFLEENSEPGYRWSCGLRRELGSWKAVLQDSRYLNEVQPKLDEMSKKLNKPKLTCENYPSGEWECGQCYPVENK